MHVLPRYGRPRRLLSRVLESETQYCPVRAAHARRWRPSFRPRTDVAASAGCVARFGRPNGRKAYLPLPIYRPIYPPPSHKAPLDNPNKKKRDPLTRTGVGYTQEELSNRPSFNLLEFPKLAGRLNHGRAARELHTKSRALPSLVLAQEMPRISEEQDAEFEDFESRVDEVGKFPGAVFYVPAVKPVLVLRTPLHAFLRKPLHALTSLVAAARMPLQR